jgi:hypothetical protein
MQHSTWVAIRDGGVAAAKAAATKRNATLKAVIAAAVGACSKTVPGNGSFSGLACCFCSGKFKTAPNLKLHLNNKP